MRDVLIFKGIQIEGGGEGEKEARLYRKTSGGPEEGAAKPASTRLRIAKDASQLFQAMEDYPVIPQAFETLLSCLLCCL